MTQTDIDKLIAEAERRGEQNGMLRASQIVRSEANRRLREGQSFRSFLAGALNDAAHEIQRQAIKPSL